MVCIMLQWINYVDITPYPPTQQTTDYADIPTLFQYGNTVSLKEYGL